MPELKTVLPNADFVIEGYVGPREPLMGWPLNALMVRLLIIIGPDLFSAMEEWKWKRKQKEGNGAVAATPEPTSETPGS